MGEVKAVPSKRGRFLGWADSSWFSRSVWQAGHTLMAWYECLMPFLKCRLSSDAPDSEAEAMEERRKREPVPIGTLLRTTF